MLWRLPCLSVTEYYLVTGGYHFINVLLHSLCTALYTILISKLTGRRVITLLSGVYFAIHPIHTEAVAGLVGRADILCAIFYIIAILSYTKYCNGRTSCVQSRFAWLALTLLSTTASMLSKEIGITVLAVCFIYDVFYHMQLTLCDLKQRRKGKVCSPRCHRLNGIW